MGKESIEFESERAYLRRLFFKQWKTIGIVFGLMMLAAFLFIASRQKIYESKAVIQLGQVGFAAADGRNFEARQLEATDLVIRRIQAETESDQDPESSFPRVKSVSVGRQDPQNVITIVAQDIAPDGARDFLEQITEKLMKEHAERHEGAMEVHQIQLQSLKDQLAIFRGDSKEAAYLAASLTKEVANPTSLLAATIMMSEKARILAVRQDLETQRSAQQLALSGLYSWPTKYLRRPENGKGLPNPRHSVYLGLAVVGGLVLGFFAAWFVESMAKGREEENVGRETTVLPALK